MESITARLAALHDLYTAAVNEAVTADRDDLIRLLADEYTDEATRMILDEAA